MRAYVYVCIYIYIYIFLADEAVEPPIRGAQLQEDVLLVGLC